VTSLPPNAAQYGVLLTPLGSHLFWYTREGSKVDWTNVAANADATEEASKTAGTQRNEDIQIR